MMENDTAQPTRQTFYCIVCGGTPLPGTVTCSVHKPVFHALHEFVSQWDTALSAEMIQALLEVLYQYDPRTGQKYTDRSVDLSCSNTPSQ